METHYQTTQDLIYKKMMKLENGIYEKEVGDIKVMINVTDKVTMTFKKGDSVNVVPLNGLEVSELFEDWRDHRRENISAEHTVKVKTLQERNQDRKSVV